MIGKATPEDLSSYVFSRTGADDDAVVSGPGYGRDTAAIRIGEQILVVNADPLSLATERIGTLGVHVACNDVAASGATPRWLTAVIFLPDDDSAVLDAITRQLDETARSVGVSIVGGHTEYAPDRSRPLLSLSCMGVTDEYLPASGARAGDRLVLTKGAGIEGTAILATDFREDLAGRVSGDVLDRAAGFFDDIGVIEDAAALGAYATAMHDPTEGGLVDGLLELATASGLAADVEREAVPIREETAAVCSAMDVDPLRVFGSGALLAAVPEGSLDAATAALDDRGIESAVIGTLSEGEPELRLDGERFRDPVRDDLYSLWE